MTYQPTSVCHSALTRRESRSSLVSFRKAEGLRTDAANGSDSLSEFNIQLALRHTPMSCFHSLDMWICGARLPIWTDIKNVNMPSVTE